jgi:hypothetical protein
VRLEHDRRTEAADRRRNFLKRITHAVCNFLRQVQNQTASERPAVAGVRRAADEVALDLPTLRIETQEPWQRVVPELFEKLVVALVLLAVYDADQGLSGPYLAVLEHRVAKFLVLRLAIAQIRQ